MCSSDLKGYSSVKTRLNQMLKDEGEGKTLKDFIRFERKKKNTNDTINNKPSRSGQIDVNDL